MLHFRLLFVLWVLAAAAWSGEGPFEKALQQAEEELAAGRAAQAQTLIVRALERDPQSVAAWDLRARAAEALGDQDERVYARHAQLRLAIAQKLPRNLLQELRSQLTALDPIAKDFLSLREVFIQKLLEIAKDYEKDKRLHSAVRIHQQVLALDSEFEISQLAIERISATRDPSLAETAKPKDLFEGISEEWIREFDADHSSWDKRGKLERPNYVTLTNAGYRVMVRAAEAMEQMNAFYREFFQYGAGDDSRSVSRIELRLFKTRDEYLKLGSNPPEWSGGIFTGSAVETYAEGGFESMVGTLFHEAAHQFVSLATNAVGWLNEGLASFFEGCRILANGTVLMNYPANHRLFPLATRMEGGWMKSADDGIDRANANQEPTSAPTFRILIENQYQWGPPWYAPTWGLVYFLYNFADPWDGRFVYRAAFREYINVSGGRTGKSAIDAFEQTVLANPAPPTKTGARKDLQPLWKGQLPRTVDEVDEVWKDWILRLRDEQNGRLEKAPPFLDWARYAIERDELDVAKEHFEKGLAARPEDCGLLVEFAKFLGVKLKNPDRASKLLLQAIVEEENQQKPDDKALQELDRLLVQFDPKRRSIQRMHEQLEAGARNLAQRYLAAGLPMMTMEISGRLGSELGFARLFEEYEIAARRCGKTLDLWKLAYNEKNLEGWLAGGDDVFTADGEQLTARFKSVEPGVYDYQFLTLDTVTSGDFSFEAEMLTEETKNTFAGLVFGRKDGSNFHALIHWPSRTGDNYYGKQAQGASVDLTTFYGSSAFKVWRHNSVTEKSSVAAGAKWHKLKLDVTGRLVDVWFDDELVVTQEFPTTDVLRGAFGLITGRGEAHWRNIRYLARKSRDPAARIQRDLVMEKLEAAASSQGRALGDSWIGRVPPFPTVAAWAQEPRQSWEDRGPVPTLLVLWAIHQNEALAIDGWLTDLEDKFRDSRLEILAITAFEDQDKLNAYLEKHPMPGSVGVDFLPRGKKGYGITFEQYAVPKFNLPRLLLLDINHQVVWEGDPGFEMAIGYLRGTESYLDAPLKDLIDRRQLDRFYPWIERWEQTGWNALAQGDLKSVAALLKEIDAMPDNTHPTLLLAREHYHILRTAIEGIEATAALLAIKEGQGALETLIEWGRLLDLPVGGETLKNLRPHLSHAHAADWRRCQDLAAELRKKLKPDNVSAASASLARFNGMKGLFAEIFVSQLKRATDVGNYDGLVYVIDGMQKIPEQWLAQEHFQWVPAEEEQ